MSVYCIGHATLTDKEALAKYREHAKTAVQKYKGELIASSPNVITLEGNPQHNSLAIVLAFPTEEDAQNWRNDPELAHIHEMRAASGDWSIQLLAAPK